MSVNRCSEDAHGGAAGGSGTVASMGETRSTKEGL